MLNKLVCIINVFMNISLVVALLLVQLIPARCNIFQKIQHGANINQLSLLVYLKTNACLYYKMALCKKNLFKI